MKSRLIWIIALALLLCCALGTGQAETGALTLDQSAIAHGDTLNVSYDLTGYLSWRMSRYV